MCGSPAHLARPIWAQAPFGPRARLIGPKAHSWLGPWALHFGVFCPYYSLVWPYYSLVFVKRLLLTLFTAAFMRRSGFSCPALAVTAGQRHLFERSSLCEVIMARPMLSVCRICRLCGALHLALAAAKPPDISAHFFAHITFEPW